MVASDPVTTADVLIPLGAALLGAAFGGGASADGSRWVHRGEITRQQRIRMYDELLPPVLLQTETNRQLLSGERPWTVKPVPAIELNALLRAAKIAGKRDAERATRIVTGGLSFQTQLIDFRRLPPASAVHPAA